MEALYYTVFIGTILGIVYGYTGLLDIIFQITNTLQPHLYHAQI